VIDEIVTLTEAEIADTIAWLWQDSRQRVEGAGACGVGAVLTGKLEAIATPAAIIVSGGNIDDARFESIASGGAPSVHPR
jgi:threonine dehydratase